jgi:uncharacterized membrane protein (DUF2068 family)
MNSSNNGLIRLVAVFKLLKAVALIVTGFGLLKLMHSDVGTQLQHWVERLGFDPGNRYVNLAIERVTNLPPGRIKELGLGSFVYAALFLTEGIGLWLLNRWAEWFTVIITASLVPLEAYEMYRHPTAIKVLVLAINLAIVAYLLYRIWTEPHRRKRRR